MENSTPRLVVGTALESSKTLSKQQKEFNRLTAEIAATRAEIRSSKAALDTLNRRSATEYQPLLDKSNALRADLVRLLDRKSRAEGLTKTERKKLSEAIVEIAFDLIDELEMVDLKPIFDRHNDTPFDEVDQESDELVSDMMRQMFGAMGVEIDDEDDLSSPEKVAEFFEKQQRAETERAEARAESAENHRRSKPKSAKTLEKEAKTAAAEAKVTQSVRKIYLDLVKAFHPDREPNEAEKGRKTEIMKRVTAAYEDNDLLALLELQLEFERTDQQKMDSMPDDQLAGFCKVLKRQLDELLHEKWGLESELPVRQRRVKGQLEPIEEGVFRLFERDLKEAKKTIKTLQKDLADLEDTRVLKVFLKSYRPKKGDFLDFF